MKNIIDLINKRKDDLLLVVNSVNDDLEFLDNVLVNNNYSKLSGLMEMNYLDVLVGYLISVSDRFSAREIFDLLENFDMQDFYEELDKEDIDILVFLSGDDKKKVKKIKRNLKEQGKDIDFDSIKLLEDAYGEDLARILFIFNIIEEMKRDYNLCINEFDEVLSELTICERVSFKKRNRCYTETLKLRYNVDNIIRDLSVIENKYNELNSFDKKKKREARKVISNYDKLLGKLNSLSCDDLININVFNNLINLVENEGILKELLMVLNEMLEGQFNINHKEYLKLSSDSEISIQAIFRKYNIDFNKLPIEIKNKAFNLKQDDLDSFLGLISLFNITLFNDICYILNNSSIKIFDDLNNYVKDGFVTRNFLISNLMFFSGDGFDDFNKKLELFRKYGINPRSIIDNLDVYLVSYEVLNNNFDNLRMYNLLDGMNKLDSFELFKGNDLCNKIDLLLELGYEKLLEGNIGVLNADISDIRKLYVLKSLGMLPSDISEVDNILSNKEFLRYVDDSYLFNIVDYRVDGNLVDDKIINIIMDSNNNDRVIEKEGIYLSRNRIVRNLDKLENINISNEEKVCYALVKGSILTEEEYDIIILNKDVIVKRLYNKK